MKKQFFADCTTLDELKKAYRKACLLNHPDNGGDTETMKAINAEYTDVFNLLKKQHNEKAKQDTTGKTKEMHECPEEFITIIQALLKMDGLTVELCGSWVWIAGNTKPYKEELKTIGCHWASKKKMWYWRNEKDSCKGTRKTKTMAEIRFKYGSETYQSNNFNSIPAFA